MAIDFPNSPVSGQEYTVGSTTWTYDGSKWNIKTVNAVTNDSMPVGAIMWFAGSAAPTAWLACNGSAVSRTTYSTLFAVVGTTYGAGDSSTTFNLPSISSTTGSYYIRYTTSLGAVTTTALATAPVGTMFDWPTTSSYPTGFLRADGSAVSRTTYADLFTLCSTTYGSGDGSTTFNLPNIVAAGAGSPVKIIKATSSGVTEPSSVAHADSHIRLGSDIIDGDRVQIDYVPSNYTRNSAATGAGANTDLTAHLSGLDNIFGVWTDFGSSVVLTQGSSLTKTVGYCRYIAFGKTIIYSGNLICGAAGTAGSVISISMPFIPNYRSNYNVIGSAAIIDSSPYTTYNMSASAQSSGLIYFHGGAANWYGVNPGLTLASGDQIAWMVTYEAA